MFIQDAEVVEQKGHELFLKTRQAQSCCACSLLCSFPRRDNIFSIKDVNGSFDKGQIVRVGVSSAGSILISVLLFIVPAAFFVVSLAVLYGKYSLSPLVSFAGALLSALGAMVISRSVLLHRPALYTVQLLDNQTLPNDD